jgi:hypothetical protein
MPTTRPYRCTAASRRSGLRPKATAMSRPPTGGTAWPRRPARDRRLQHAERAGPGRGRAGLHPRCAGAVLRLASRCLRTGRPEDEPDARHLRCLGAAASGGRRGRPGRASIDHRDRRFAAAWPSAPGLHVLARPSPVQVELRPWCRARCARTGGTSRRLARRDECLAHVAGRDADGACRGGLSWAVTSPAGPAGTAAPAPGTAAALR